MTVTVTAPQRSRRPVRGSRRASRWWADAAGSAAAGSVIIVLALWVAGQGVQNLEGADGGLASLGRLTGLLAADLMLLQVLLMARIPWVERAYGQDALARRHRWFGFASFWLMAAHIVLVTLGYEATAPMGLLRQVWSLVWTYPGMLLATAATALLFAVVLTSIRAARRRLRYESWHLIHLYAYLGVGLALPHQLWTGADFIATPWARTYWWTLYLTALGSVLMFRLGLPAWRSARHRLVVEQVLPEAPGVVSVHLSGRRLHQLPVRAGQFFLWRFLDGPGWSRAHPYSLSAPPAGDRLRITVKDLGDGSARLAALRPGIRVVIEGPYGAMTAPAAQPRPVVMFAAGIGITAIRALIEDPDIACRPVTLLYRTRGGHEPVFARELAAIAARQPLRVVYLHGPRPPRASFLPAHLAGRSDAAALRRLVPDVRDCDAFICGPVPWMRAARAALLGAGTPRDRIHAEEFAW
ncbi:ferredoxin reductase family protein [Catellatospora chokoriensis]|uniref:Oxidoreductase n=1 Tax=Catellatospora chokoriensis TaxID=310353 RepID=A0A8J3JXM3_9ACTN|nr:ferredoxin reductase family protein [Catellatospora chokoriensis]GIF93032.1 oxidoreductase [Catellatospora chokoriensis]